MTKGFLFILSSITLAAAVSSCCEPQSRNSLPVVVDSLYHDSAVFDQYPLGIHSDGRPPDSGYYPVYTLGIKNAGTETDTFTLRFDRLGNGFELPIEIKHEVPAGQTVLFSTPATLNETSDTLAQSYYASFFVRTQDSIPIYRMRPTVTVKYGAVYNGPEGCNSDPITNTLNVDALAK